jgi:hypothetical protein
MRVLALAAAALGLGRFFPALDRRLPAAPQLPPELKPVIEQPVRANKHHGRDHRIQPALCLTCASMGRPKGCPECHRTRPRKLYRRVMWARSW